MTHRTINAAVVAWTLGLVPLAARADVATQIVAGGNHACALNDAGGVVCWGLSQYGQLGNGSFDESRTPVAVSGLGSGVASLGAGEVNTCAVTGAGAVLCWGSNNEGQLADGTDDDSALPLPVTGLGSGVASVDGGWSHICAVTTAGGLVCWGGNMFGQLGDGTTTSRTAPVGVVGLSSGVAAVAPGQLHTCALTTAGGVKCWGDNRSGQLGDGTTTDSPTPVDVVGLASGVSAIASQGSHTCALLATGGVKCWGQNHEGALGDGTTVSRSAPVDVIGVSGAVALETTSALCALTAGGTATCWGERALTARQMPFFAGMTSLVRATSTLVGINQDGEIRSSKGGRFISGYGPRAALHWPFGCTLGFGDEDGDAVCDTMDPCSTLDAGQQFGFSEAPTPGPKPSLVVRRIGTETTPGNDVLTLRAQLHLPPSLAFGDLAPATEGMRLAFLNPAGVAADVTYAAGVAGGAGTSGWRLVSGTKPRWEFLDRTGGTSGRQQITKLTVTDRSAGAAGGLLDVVIAMKAGTIPLARADLPLQLALVLGDAAAGEAGACGEGLFARSCRFSGNGATLNCRSSIFDPYIFF